MRVAIDNEYGFTTDESEALRLPLAGFLAAMALSAALWGVIGWAAVRLFI